MVVLTSIIIVAFINRSIDESVMPLSLKLTTISTLLKRLGLDKEDMKINPNFNLNLFSKLTEKVLAARIEEQLEQNDLYP